MVRPGEIGRGMKRELRRESCCNCNQNVFMAADSDAITDGRADDPAPETRNQKNKARNQKNG